MLFTNSQLSVCEVNLFKIILLILKDVHAELAESEINHLKNTLDSKRKKPEKKKKIYE
jgi:hypothetical protein